MTETKTTDGEGKRTGTMSEEQLAKKRAGQEQKSSHDDMSRVRAGTGEGAGGGAKQKQGH